MHDAGPVRLALFDHNLDRSGNLYSFFKWSSLALGLWDGKHSRSSGHLFTVRSFLVSFNLYTIEADG
jgi:hypothetical protein